MLRARALVVPLALVACLTLTGCGAVDRIRDVVHQATSGDDADQYYDDGGYDGTTPNTDVDDLQPGDCFLDNYDDDVVTAVEAVACDTEHDDEVTAVVKVDGDEFPGDLRVDKAGQIDCRDALASYVGRDFATSSLDYWYFVPDSTQWNSGMHSVVCYAYSWGGDTLDATVKGSKI